MSDHDGSTPNLRPGPDDDRDFTSFLRRFNTQLDRLAAHMDAAEERATANEEQATANIKRAAANEERAAARDIRITAMFKNLDRRADNAARYRYFRSPEVALQQMIDLRTGDEIVGFPTSVAELSRLDEAAARNILDALQVDHQESDSAGVRELLRYYAFYA
ncbi:hypothetical protein HDV62DRAFT_301381 [Trichoderma sp. SZMC 28011]